MTSPLEDSRRVGPEVSSSAVNVLLDLFASGCSSAVGLNGSDLLLGHLVVGWERSSEDTPAEAWCCTSRELWLPGWAALVAPRVEDLSPSVGGRMVEESRGETSFGSEESGAPRLVQEESGSITPWVAARESESVPVLFSSNSSCASGLTGSLPTPPECPNPHRGIGTDPG